MFQSAPPHGGRPNAASQDRIRLTFQSAPPHGGRLSSPEDPHVERGFNPRPRTGGDKSFVALQRIRNRFNPRPRTGGDRGRPKRPEESRLVSSLREPCLVGDVTHPHNTFTPSQPLG